MQESRSGRANSDAHAGPGRGNIHHLLTPRYDQEASRTRMTVEVYREEENIFVARLEEVLPLLREGSA